MITHWLSSHEQCTWLLAFNLSFFLLGDSDRSGLLGAHGNLFLKVVVTERVLLINLHVHGQEHLIMRVRLTIEVVSGVLHQELIIS
jgi:hypothetical protein